MVNNFQEKANFIWQVADDILRGAFKANEVEDHQGLQAVMQADNPLDVKRYKFEQVLDEMLLEFVHTKLELYKKLTEPKVNQLLKRQWFEGFVRGVGC